MIIIFRVIKIFQKDRNLMFFVIYFYKINILPSTWKYWIKNLLKFMPLSEEMFNLFLLKYRHFDNGLNNK